MAINQVKRAYQGLPPKVRAFLIRAAILFVAWLLLYNLLLKPANVPDRQLTALIEWGTAKFLSLFYPDVHIIGLYVYTGTEPAIGIANECNGLELIVLYWGFLACMPTSAGRLIGYALSGFVIICILNVLRCSGLAWMNLNHNSMFDIAHHFVFKLVIYAVVFWMWMQYSKKFMASTRNTTANGVQA